MKPKIRAYSEEYYRWSKSFCWTLGYYKQEGGYQVWYPNENLNGFTPDQQFSHNMNYVSDFEPIKKMPEIIGFTVQ